MVPEALRPSPGDEDAGSPSSRLVLCSTLLASWRARRLTNAPQARPSTGDTPGRDWKRSPDTSTGTERTPMTNTSSSGRWQTTRHATQTTILPIPHPFQTSPLPISLSFGFQPPRPGKLRPRRRSQPQPAQRLAPRARPPGLPRLRHRLLPALLGSGAGATPRARHGPRRARRHRPPRRPLGPQQPAAPAALPARSGGEALPLG